MVRLYWLDAGSIVGLWLDGSVAPGRQGTDVQRVGARAGTSREIRSGIPSEARRRRLPVALGAGHAPARCKRADREMVRNVHRHRRPKTHGARTWLIPPNQPLKRSGVALQGL